MTRKTLHCVLALILVACALTPFVELAIGWNDTILSTGYDTETTIAVLALLFELVLSLASAIVVLVVVGRHKTERLIAREQVSAAARAVGIPLGCDSPPPPLRI